MKLSAKACYGITTLVELARHWEKGPTLLKDIALNQNISLPYLTRLVSPLIASGLVRSMRGLHGGVWLTRSPHEVRFNEIIRLLEGTIYPRECVTNPDICSQSDICAARDVWIKLGKKTDELLGAITLQDIMEQQDIKERGKETMYYI